MSVPTEPRMWPASKNSKRQLRVLAGQQALAGHVEARVQRHGAPALDGEIDLAMREERVLGDAFVALFHHHVHRIVEHHVAELARGLGHEDRRLRLAAHEHGQRAHVVLVRVREDDGVDRAVRQPAEIGQGGGAIEARMQSGIEDDAFPGEFEAVAVGADFDPPGQISEGETSHDLRATCGRGGAMANDFATFHPSSRFVRQSVAEVSILNLNLNPNP